MLFEICSSSGILLKNKLPVALSLMLLYSPSRIWTVSRSVEGLNTLKNCDEKCLIHRDIHCYLFSKGMIILNNLKQITLTEK